MRVRMEHGPRAEKVVAYAADWPGLERNAPNEPAALATLITYRSRYEDIARRAGLHDEYLRETGIDIIERYKGSTSTDYHGLSFASSPQERESPILPDDCDRQLLILNACWEYFDDVAERVSAELRKGPSGGGRNREQILSHVYGAEIQWAKRVKVNTPPGFLLLPHRRREHRDKFTAGVRAACAAGKPAGDWTLSFLIRRTAYHLMDHAWEMEDKDLSADAPQG